MEKQGDFYVIFYTAPHNPEIKHPIHSLKDKAMAEMYLDGVMSGIGMVRQLMGYISETATRVPE